MLHPIPLKREEKQAVLEGMNRFFSNPNNRINKIPIGKSGLSENALISRCSIDKDVEISNLEYPVVDPSEE